MTHESTLTGTSPISGNREGRKQLKYEEVTRFRGLSGVGTMALLLLAAVIVSLSGCGGGGGGLSTQVVSGVAAVGAALSGEVGLKDSSAAPKEKTTVIGNDGSFAIDVTDMQPPFILEARGSAAGKSYRLHSFADGHGIANINPLSDVVVASAAEVDDASTVYERPDHDKMDRIGRNLPMAVSVLLSKLQPLLQHYNAANTNPITSRYIANHLGLDDMFDHVKIAVDDGTLSIVLTSTGEVIFTGKVTDIANGNFNPGMLPPPAAPPSVPTGLTSTGGSAQVTLGWTSVSNATSYNLYYSTTSGVTTTSGTKIPGAANPYTHAGLAAGTTYYYVVTAVNSAGESAASAEVSATTTAVAPPPAVPAAPAGVSSTGGTRQVTISWSAVAGATSYNIYWSNTAGVTVSNGTKITGAASPAVHSGLTDSTSYYYIVTAVNGTGESAPSVQVAATTLAAAPAPSLPAAPGGASATGGTNQATVSWSPVSGATSYNLYWSTTPGAGTSGTKLAGVTSPYVHSGLSAGTTYYYVVTAVNGVGESPSSTQITATTTASAPAFDALSFYTNICLGCHGSLGQRTAAQITSAINSVGAMSRFRSTGSTPLTADQIAAIAAVSY